MVYLGAWYDALRPQTRVDGLLTVFDQGPIFRLALLREFGPELTKSLAFEKWWESALLRWAAALDCVVLLDAPDEVLMTRVQVRDHTHVFRGMPVPGARVFLARYRAAYEQIMRKMADAGGPRVLRFDTSREPVDRIVDRILSALETPPSRPAFAVRATASEGIMASERSGFSSAISRWLSDEGLAKKAYLNALASALDYAARLLVGFVTNPLLVGGLGSYGFGLWQVLRQLIGYITPASGRPTQALKWTIANQQASTDWEEKRRQVGSSVVVGLLFSPILLALGGLLAWFAPAWLDAPETLVTSTRIAAALLVGHVVVTSLVEIPRSVLGGENLGYKRMGLSTLLVFVGGGLTIVALRLETGLVGVAAVPLVVGVLTGVLFLRVVRRHVPWFGLARPSRPALRRFLGLSGWFLAWRFVMQVMQASDVVLLGIFDSVEQAGTYSLTKYVPESMINLVAIVVFGITPGLGGIVGAGQLERARRIRGEIMALTWLIATAGGVTILLWNRAFVGLWVGPEHYAGSLSTLLILAMVTQFVLIRNDAAIIDLTLDLRNKVLLGVLSAVVSLGLAAALVGALRMGVVGMCLGLITGRLLLSVAYPWIVGRSLQVPPSEQILAGLRPALAGCLLVGAALRADALFTASSWPGIAFGSALTLSLVAPLAFFLGLPRGPREGIARRARALWG